METIKNYLEAMFAGMPNTAEVRKAKDELLQMMEDKYNELIAEGQSENTAVGTVISEFGNLDELADELGLSKEVSETRLTESELPRRDVSMEEAIAYISDTAKGSLFLAIGVMFCIISVAGPILFTSNERIGAVLMFLSIATGVGLILFSNYYGTEWKYLKKEPCLLDMATTSYVKERRRSFEAVRSICITIGVILCIICWLPNVYFPFKSLNLAPAIMFLLIGFGVLLIVYANGCYGAFETLLNLNDSNTISGTYATRDEKPVKYKSTACETIVNVYWPAVTSAYLIASFLTFRWDLTWIIWPIAGVMHKAVIINCRADEE